MRVGLIARAEDRGLGNLTRESYEHMKPDRTLIVRPTAADDAGLAFNVGWYTRDTTVMHWHPTGLPLDETSTKEWLDGLDVVYSAETFYDPRFFDWARELKVKTVLHVMPEYYSPTHAYQRATALWAPTSYRLAALPEGTRVVPVPCPTHRFQPEPRFDVSHTPMTWLHPAGAPAKKDRNGTMQVMRAIPKLREQQAVWFTGQSEIPRPSPNPHVAVQVIDNATNVNYWDLYRDIDAVIIPRKYGGLCMPALEAMAAGCALVMPNTSPQCFEWPIVPIPVHRGPMEFLRVYGQSIPITTVQPEDVAATMDELATDVGPLVRARQRSIEFAHANSWAVLGPQIRDELERLVPRKRRA